mmetsp:Transcript_37658/g.116337  ORF Transcript_37658/g.116337 Transcript_37658/m.116337 type:complete len:297 (-) Transcript_37658:157-1047(-)
MRSVSDAAFPSYGMACWVSWSSPSTRFFVRRFTSPLPSAMTVDRIASSAKIMMYVTAGAPIAKARKNAAAAGSVSAVSDRPDTMSKYLAKSTSLITAKVIARMARPALIASSEDASTMRVSTLASAASAAMSIVTLSAHIVASSISRNEKCAFRLFVRYRCSARSRDEKTTSGSAAHLTSTSQSSSGSCMSPAHITASAAHSVPAARRSGNAAARRFRRERYATTHTSGMAWCRPTYVAEMARPSESTNARRPTAPEMTQIASRFCSRRAWRLRKSRCDGRQKMSMTRANKMAHPP